MKINLEFLQAKGACREAIEEFKESWDKEITPVYAIGRLIKEDKLEWGNWLIVRCMGYKQYVAYAIYAAKQVLNIFEAKYPNDTRPREAIEAAEKCLKNPSQKNKKAAAAANAAAAAAAYAAAANAAYAAANAAAAAYAVAANAAYAVAYAAYAAAYAAYAKRKMQLKILRYGIKLLKKEKEAR